MELSAARHPHPCHEKTVTYVTHRNITDALARCRFATLPIHLRQSGAIPWRSSSLFHARTMRMIDS